MSVVIKSVRKKSAAYKAGIKAGDSLVSINANEITDVLDYRFFADGEGCTFEVMRDGESFFADLDCTADAGLEFDTYLMDKHRRCQNNCIFCFIDQMPKGMRDSLYFKDDDSRLSFLFGNYITLTNLTDKEVDRIIKMHISPVNISVHTTKPELRVKMMRNKRAGEALKIMDRLNDAGISMNCQIVACPGINDGEELIRSLSDLAKLGCVECVSVVPVGITKHRDGLCELKQYNKEAAAQIIDIVDSFFDGSNRRFYAADEFYLLAGRKLPDAEFYGEFLQLENGVGLCSLTESEAKARLCAVKPPKRKRHVGIVTGVAAADIITNIVDTVKTKWHNLECEVYAIKNDHFGHTITVAGLVTGGDIINQLKGKNLPKELLIPACMLREGNGLFLDDVSVKDLKKALGVKITVVEQNGIALIDALR